jgi:hypothetical protein
MHRSRLLLSLAAAGLATVVGTAGAEANPYYLGISQTFSHNSNLLGLGDGQEAPAGFSRSDSISSTALLAGLDQPFGRQRLFGNVALRSNRLSNNDVYNNESYALTAGLDWATVNNISGNLKASANRNLASFNSTEIGLLTKKNVETTQQFDGTVRIGVVTAWTAEASVGTRSVDYSAIEYESREFRQNSLSVGMRYRPSAASNFGIAVSSAKGRYPKFRPLDNTGTNFEADTYNRRDVDFTANLTPSAASDLSARISVGNTSYDIASDRDFSGVTGQISWNWRPTGKLRFNTMLTRDPGQDSYFLASQISDATIDYSRLTTALNLRADYDVAAKVSLNANLGLSRSSLTRTIPLLTNISETGSEHNVHWGFGAVWVPLRSLQVGCDLGRDQRSGTAPLSSDLHDSTVSCYGQFTLQ